MLLAAVNSQRDIFDSSKENGGFDFWLQTWKEVALTVFIASGASSSLESGLKLLCNSEKSVIAVCDAVRHASKTVCL